MSENELVQILKQPFEKSQWISILDFVFPGNEIFAFEQDKELDYSYKEKLATSITEFGSITLNDESHIRFYDVLLKDSVKLTQNRVGLRNLIKSNIITGLVDAALVTFRIEGDSKWRFSYISKEFDGDALKDIDTQDPKRYTYVLGQGEKCRTPAQRFIEIAQKAILTKADLIEAFSVESLSKDFFNQYKGIYNDFIADALDNPSLKSQFKSEKTLRDFIKKMLGRIVFLHFLQKKDWMGARTKWKNGNTNFLEDLYSKCEDKGQFYNDFLRPLFFDTLNVDRSKIDDDCIIQGINFNKVPYLNGGLFEEDEDHPLYIGFSHSHFENLLEVFGRYNFTIVEDDPYEKQVAVDPEMLGRIFENLLENNHDVGTYYTPPSIVGYMCRQSIVQYLKTYLTKRKVINETDDSALKRFIFNQEASDIIEYEHDVIRALKEIKVCDPAIGSGAFPMGILQEILRAVENLHYASPDVVEEIWGLKNGWEPAKIKLEIIQNSIYGVDIEKGAVDIARLRFWLSLIVDEEEPYPLPNLDYKIMQGDSLLERYKHTDLKFIPKSQSNEKDRDLFGNVIDPQLSLSDALAKSDINISELEKRYFSTTNLALKQKLKNIITQFEKDLLLQNFQKSIDKLDDEIENLSKNITKNQYIQANKIEKDRKKLELAVHKRDELKKDLKLIADIKEGSKPYFLWYLYFRDILFDENNPNSGFDVVIGNPPYIQLQAMREMADRLAEVKYSTYSRTGDIYSLFYEKGFDILKQNGVLTYITSNKWMRAGYGMNTRKYFLEKTNPIQLIDFGDARFFENATTYTNILMATKADNERATTVTDLSLNYNHQLDLEKNLVTSDKYQPEFTEGSFLLVKQSELEVKRKIEKKGVQLKYWDIDIYRGILTGLNDAFIIDGSTKDEFISKDIDCAQIIKPILNGRDVKKYYCDFEDNWIINTHNGIKPEIPAINVELDYNLIYLYLEQFGDRIVKRADQGDHWSNLRNCAYINEFEKTKIVWGNLNVEATFAIDEHQRFINAPTNMLTCSSEDVSIYFLGAILNSKLTTFMMRKIGYERRGGYVEYKKVFVEQLPIPIIPKDKQLPFEEKVKKIMALTDKKENIKDLENEIDLMVYKLYSLTHDEVLIIDKNFEVSESEYKSLVFE